MIYRYLVLFCLLSVSGYLFAQEDEDWDNDFQEDSTSVEVVKKTFSSTRVINGHSTETLEKNVMEFRVEHRFGDVAGTNGGIQTMFGFDNVADIRLGFEYGITDRIMVGLGRSKGTGAPYRSLIDGLVKYRILEQKTKGMPISMAVLGMGTITYMKASDDLSEVSSFPNWQHRLAYATQLIVSRKFGSHVSLALSPTVVHRNYVAANDQNTLFALGGAARFAVGKKVGIILEYFHTFRNEPIHFFDKNNPNTFRNSLGVAVEFETFGHNFTINLTNSKGFGETQFIPYTYEDWLLGQFRLGFTIGRKFSF